MAKTKWKYVNELMNGLRTDEGRAALVAIILEHNSVVQCEDIEVPRKIALRYIPVLEKSGLYDGAGCLSQNLKEFDKAIENYDKARMVKSAARMCFNKGDVEGGLRRLIQIEAIGDAKDIARQQKKMGLFIRMCEEEGAHEHAGSEAKYNDDLETAARNCEKAAEKYETNGYDKNKKQNQYNQSAHDAFWANLGLGHYKKAIEICVRFDLNSNRQDEIIEKIGIEKTIEICEKLKAHKLAARLCASNNLPERAIENYLKIKDWLNFQAAEEIAEEHGLVDILLNIQEMRGDFQSAQYTATEAKRKKLAIVYKKITDLLPDASSHLEEPLFY